MNTQHTTVRPADRSTILARKAEGERAWQLIRESGVKRRFVARALGVSYGYFNQASYGHCTLTANLKARLSGYLGVPVEELFPHGAEPV